MQAVDDTMKVAINKIVTHLKQHNNVSNLHLISYQQNFSRSMRTGEHSYEYDLPLNYPSLIEVISAGIGHVTGNKTYLFSTLTNKENSQQSLKDLITLSRILLATDISTIWQAHTYQIAFGDQIISSLVIHNDQQPHLVYLATPIANTLCYSISTQTNNKNFYNLCQINQLETLKPPAQTYLKQIIKLDHSLTPKTLTQCLTLLFKQALDNTIKYSLNDPSHPACLLLDLNWLTANLNTSTSTLYDLKLTSTLPPEAKTVLNYLAKLL